MINIIAIDQNDPNLSTSNFHIFDMINILEKIYKYEVIDISLLYENNINEILLKKFRKLPDNILIFKGSSGIKDFNTDKNISISFFIDDIHQGGTVKRNRIKSLNKVTNVFNTYAYTFNKYYPKIDYKLFWLPHSTRFMDISFNNKPIQKIIITGRLNKEIYPNRQKLYNLSKKHKKIEYFKPNVGYRLKKSQIEEDTNNNFIYENKFYLFLNKYLCGFTCDASHERPYIVAKHFEIMGSGVLLLACNPNTKQYFQMLGYNDIEHYISCTPDNMEERIEFILNPDNRELIDKIRKTGYEYTITNHNYELRTEFLHNVLTNNDDSKYDVYKSFI
jgi:hypothetical protein